MRDHQEKLYIDIDCHIDRYVEELCEFLSIPSVSSGTEHEEDMVSAAQWLLDRLQNLGFSGTLHYAGGPPIIVAQKKHQKNVPTLLIYGHYDVQPESPVDEWLSPPFVPTIRNGAIYARGANDDKGQLFTYIKAIETCQRIIGALPFNIIFVVEGEEEIGSSSLLDFIEQHVEELHSDVFFVSDSSMFAKDVPAITCGFRGIVSFEMSVQTMAQDLHSGLFGGIALNAAEMLTQLLAQMKDDNGHILIPHFYDHVDLISRCDRQQLNQLQYDEQKTANLLGMRRLFGEPEYSAMERKSLRPTLDINGIWGGFTGTGSKTVIPAKAFAKISSRLVSGQTPEDVFELFKRFICERVPAGVQVDFRYMFGSLPVSIDVSDPNIRLAARAIEAGFGCAPVLMRSGGTIHIISHIQHTLHIPSTLILGWGRPENGSHSPNECFHIIDFKNAIRSLCVLFADMAKS